MKLRCKQTLAILLILTMILPVGILKAHASSGLTAYVEEIYGNEVIITGNTLPNTSVTLKLIRVEDNNIRYTNETKSNVKGSFEFAVNIEPGEYKAVVSAIGLSVETRCNVNDIYAGTVTVRVEGKNSTLLKETRVDIEAGYTTYYMAVTKALKDNGVKYTEEGKSIAGIGPENEGAGSEGWQWMVNGGGGQTLPTDLVNQYDDIVLVVGDLWNPTITQLKVSTESGNIIDKNNIEIIKGNLFTVRLEQFDVDIFGDVSKSPVPNQTIRFGNEKKQTDENGEAVFIANSEGMFIVSCEPTKNEEGNPLIRPVPINIKVRKDPNEGGDPNGKNTVTLSIDTQTIGGGYFIEDKEMELRPRDTAYDILERAIGRSNLKTTGSGSSVYVASMRLDGEWIGEFDHGSGSGWMYNVNGTYPNVSAGAYRVDGGDSINWRYTTDLGADLGHYIGDTPPVDGKPNPNAENIRNAELKGLLDSISRMNITDLQIQKEAEKVISKIINEIDVKNMKPSEIKDIINDLNIIADILVDKVQNVSYIENVLVDIVENMGELKDSIDKEDSMNYQKTLLMTVQKALNKKSKIKVNSEKITELNIIDIENISKFNRNLIKAIEREKLTNGKKLEAVLTFNMEKKIEKIIIPTNILEKIIKSDMKYLRLNFSAGTMKISINQLSSEREMIVIMKNMADYTEIGITPNKRFTVPITIRLPYEKSGTGKTVIREDDGGNRENLGGIYHKDSKYMIFTTNENSKYYIVNNPVSFRDLNKHKWAEESINMMAIKGIVDGKSEELFAPADSITRAEFSALLVRAAKTVLPDNKKVFADVKANAWYSEYINAAYFNGLMKGRTENVFDPNGKITRQELAQAMANVLKIVGYESDGRQYLDKFDDKDQISEWAKEGANLSVQFELINGTNGNFNPKKDATRAEAIVMLDRLYSLIIDQ